MLVPCICDVLSSVGVFRFRFVIFDAENAVFDG